jgi:hypothetical protein
VTIGNFGAGVLTYDGTAWSSATSLDSRGGLTAVSCSSQSFCVAVDSAGRALIYDGLSVTTASLPGGSVGEAYRSTLSATGGIPPYTWKLVGGSKLPKGLRLDHATGVVAGTPTRTGTVTFTVEVTDSKTMTTPRKHADDTKAYSVTIS